MYCHSLDAQAAMKEGVGNASLMALGKVRVQTTVLGKGLSPTLTDLTTG